MKPLLTLIALHLAASVAAAQFDATVRAAYDAELAFTVTGRVAKVLIAPGDKVEAGQPLVELDTAAQTLIVQLAKLEAESDAAVRLVERQLELARGSNPAKADVKLLEIELEATRLEQQRARERHEQAKLQLEAHTLKAPVAGVIERIDAAEGAVVKAAQPIVRLIQGQTLLVDAAVPTGMTTSLNVGDSAEVRLAGDEAEPLQGKIVHLAHTIDPETDTRLVRIELANPGDVLPGAFATVRFPAKQAASETKRVAVVQNL